jgi:hypothetical protein
VKTRELDLVKKNYADEQEKLKSKLETTSDEEKHQLLHEIKQLTTAQEENRTQLEEGARKQETWLKKKNFPELIFLLSGALL